MRTKISIFQLRLFLSFWYYVHTKFHTYHSEPAVKIFHKNFLVSQHLIRVI
jgi:hypothetical protein